MDARCFDHLAQALHSDGTRRGLLGLVAAGLLGTLSLGNAEAKKHGKKKKCKKKCGPCAKCKKGKCKPKAAGTSCGEGKQCFANGQCVACDVCASGCSHDSLQDAINAAGEGARIQLCPGTYPTNAQMLSKDVTVIGAGAGQGGTVLDGQRRFRVLAVSETTLDMRHLTITGGSVNVGGGIAAFSSTLALVDVHITGNNAEVGGGISADDSNVILIDSRVTDNLAENGGGIRNGFGSVTLSASTVTENVATGGPGSAGGIDNHSGGTVEIVNGSSVTGNHPVNCAGTSAC